MRKWRLLLCVGAGLLGCAPALAQNVFGTVLGTVTDPSGAAVPGASVAVTNKSTGETFRTQSNATGYYEYPYLKPGVYDVAVSASGFKSAVRQAVRVEVEGRHRVDFALEVGDVRSTVTIAETVPPVQTESASLGRVVPERNIQELPVMGRNVFELAGLVAGVQMNPLVAERQVVAEGDFGSADISVSGGRFRTNEFLLDGVTVMLPANNFPGMTPTPEATQELKVMTGNSGAQFGRTGGGVFNVVTKGGTNEFGGTAFFFLRDERLQANTFFANARGLKLSPFNYYMFGGTVGGPIIRNRTFFFLEYQGMRRDTESGEGVRTLPTEEQRRGDFSQTRTSAGQVITIYDPFSTVPNPAGTGYVRSPVPGNRIPASRIDPVAARVVPHIPLPNRPGEGPALINNYVYFQESHESTDQASLRLDHRFNDRHTFFSRFSGSLFRHSTVGDYKTWADTDGENLTTPFLNAVLNGTLVLSPVNLMNYRYGVTRYFRDTVPLHQGKVPLAELGFPAAIVAKVQVQSFPQMSFTGYSGIGTPPGVRTGNDVHSWALDFTRIQGSHTIKTGADLRVYNQTPFRPSQASGSYSFTRAFTQGPDPLRSALGRGDGFASFLYGYGTGFIQYSPAFAIRNGYFAFFIQDDIRAGPLTLNLGLRWDYEQPRTERYNRFANFDFNRPLPFSPPGYAELRGVLVQAGTEGYPRGQFECAKRNFAPQVGLAWRLSKSFAVRSAFGVFYYPRMGSPNAREFGASGAEITTQWVSSLDGVTPLRPLSNPFPEGIFLPPANEAERRLVGQALTVTDRGSRNNTYSAQWNLTLERGLPGNSAVEAAYVGSRGIRLPAAVEFNQVHPQYLSYGAALNSLVRNPFAGLVQAGPLSLSEVSLAQLLRPYPHYLGIASINTAADSYYHSLTLTFDKRFSHGFSLLVTYTAAKTIDTASGRVIDVPGAGLRPPAQNQYDRRSERAVSQQDISQRLVLSHTAELPVGRGRAWLSRTSRLLDLLVGGWNLSGQATFITGFPLALTSTGSAGLFNAVLRPNNSGRSAKLEGTVQSRLVRFFDTSVFTIPEPFSLGNTGRTLPDVRSPGRRNYNLALTKNVRWTERRTIQLRAEAYNLTNTPYFGFPGTTVGSNQLGIINSARNAREFQLALKFLW